MRYKCRICMFVDMDEIDGRNFHGTLDAHLPFIPAPGDSLILGANQETMYGPGIMELHTITGVAFEVARNRFVLDVSPLVIHKTPEAPRTPAAEIKAWFSQEWIWVDFDD